MSLSANDSQMPLEKRVKRSASPNTVRAVTSVSSLFAPAPSAAITHRFGTIAVQPPQVSDTAVFVRRDGADNKGMVSCPPTEAEMKSGHYPELFNPYYGTPWVFHGESTGYVEKRQPTLTPYPIPQNECFYNPDGTLDTSATGGTPDCYNAETDKLKHSLCDPGGIMELGCGPMGIGSWSFTGFNAALASAKGYPSHLPDVADSLFSYAYDRLLGGASYLWDGAWNGLFGGASENESGGG